MSDGVSVVQSLSFQDLLPLSVKLNLEQTICMISSRLQIFMILMILENIDMNKSIN